MTHDKYCEDTDLGSGWICICDIIAQVRADEREQAAQRVATLEPTQDFGFMRVWRDEAIAAASNRDVTDADFRATWVVAAARGEDTTNADS